MIVLLRMLAREQFQFGAHQYQTKIVWRPGFISWKILAESDGLAVLLELDKLTFYWDFTHCQNCKIPKPYGLGGWTPYPIGQKLRSCCFKCQSSEQDVCSSTNGQGEKFEGQLQIIIVPVRMDQLLDQFNSSSRSNTHWDSLVGCKWWTNRLKLFKSNIRSLLRALSWSFYVWDIIITHLENMLKANIGI